MKRRLALHAAASCAALAVGLLSSSLRADDFTAIVKTGTAVPDVPGATFSSVDLAGVDAASGAAFIGTFTIGSDTRSGLYNYKNGVITPMAGATTVGPGGETFTGITGAGDYDNGVIVFAASTSNGNALYRYTPGGLTAVVHEGDVLPGGGGVAVASFFSGAVSGDATDFSFAAQRNDASQAIYSSVGGFGMQLVDDKTRAGVAELGNFIEFPSVHYRNGATAFIGTAMDPDNPDAEPEPAGVFVARPGNPFEIVAGKNMPLPNGHDGDERFKDFDHARILPSGAVAFTGAFVDEGEEDKTDAFPDHHAGVFVRNDDLTWKIYADSDMNLDGLNSPIAEFNGYSLETGVNFFNVLDEAGGTYIYYEDSFGTFKKLIDSYSELDGKTIASVQMLNDTAIGAELFFRVDFTDGTSGVYASTVPEPASLAIASGALGLLLKRRRRN